MESKRYLLNYLGTDTPYLLDGYGVLVFRIVIFRIYSFKLQNAKWKLTGIPCKHAVGACWNMALNDRAKPPPEAWVGRPKKKRKRSKHEDEPFVKDGKLSKKGRTITCQSCRNIGHNKATCKGQGGNNAESSGSASRQAQQAEPTVGQDGSGRSGVGAVIGLSTADFAGGVVTKTRHADGRELSDDIPTQSSAEGGASEWSFIEFLIPTPWSDESKNEKKAKRWREEFEWKISLFEIDLTFGINAFDLDKGTEVMKDKVSQEHVCEEDVPLNNNIKKQGGDLVEMPNEAVEQGMDDHLPDEIDGVIPPKSGRIRNR
ncbi:hypothetical protein Tco_0688061 [Tanacetum coccineum]